MPLPTTIAIDGPAASGKSTVGKQLADHLGYLFFDTGLMYRAITWAALDRAVDLRDENGVTQLAEGVHIDVHGPSKDDGRGCDLLVDGRDVTWEIRSPAVDANVSIVAAYPGVRTAMTAQQRRIGLRGRVVMVGRDIGTVVLPEADLKVYLDASVEERARRRWEEQRSRGEDADRAGILASMRRRDEIDSTRAVAPLRPADDAVILNSDQLDENQVLDKLIELAS
ncbi:MAG: (d)CMP kinase [Chloroflexota bacterium]